MGRRRLDSGLGSCYKDLIAVEDLRFPRYRKWPEEACDLSQGWPILPSFGHRMLLELCGAVVGKDTASVVVANACMA